MASYFILFVIISYALHKNSVFAAPSKEEQLVEAGCKKKHWNQDGKLWDETLNKTFDWVASGELLERGACLEEGYQPWLIPEKGVTMVYSAIEKVFLREIIVGVRLEYTLTLSWIDTRIKTNFSTGEGPRNNETSMALQVNVLNGIWRPDLYIFNRSAFLDPYGTRSTISLKLYSLNMYNKLHGTNIKEIHSNNYSTIVEYKSEIRSWVFCNFDYSRYPMDTHECTLRLGSRGSSAAFVLSGVSPGTIPIYNAAGFEISTTLFDENIRNGNNTIGVKLNMRRRLKSFIMKYYTPAILVTMVSEVSFMLSLIGYGRIGLLVTLLLTMINLFIHHLVSIRDIGEGAQPIIIIRLLLLSLTLTYL